MTPKDEDGLVLQGIPKMLYLDNGPVAKSAVFRRVMAQLSVEVRTHMPKGSDGRRVTARAKGKVERPFRTVKEAHETLYHFLGSRLVWLPSRAGQLLESACGEGQGHRSWRRPGAMGGLDLCPPQPSRAHGGDQHELAAASSHIPKKPRAHRWRGGLERCATKHENVCPFL
jgi:hypothetical protein